jgi:hypothetical protein
MELDLKDCCLVVIDLAFEAGEEWEEHYYLEGFSPRISQSYAFDEGLSYSILYDLPSCAAYEELVLYVDEVLSILYQIQVGQLNRLFFVLLVDTY